MGPGGQIALQGGIDIAGGVVGNLFQKRNVRLQKEANLELADYAYDKDQEMWHMQNLYNSPKAQMQRFEQAGLNPNLIYGQGSPGNASAMPKRQQVTSAMRDTKIPKLNMIQAYQNVATQEAQRKNIEADTKYKDELGQTQTFVTTLKEIDAQLEDARLAFWQGKGPQSKYNDKHGNRYQTLFTDMQRGTDAKLYANNLTAKKQDLLDAQIDLTWQNLLTQQRRYRWMPWEKGFGMTTKAAGMALGASGVKKIGKFTKGTAPKLKKFTPKGKGFNYWNQANRAFSQRNNPW